MLEPHKDRVNPKLKNLGVTHEETKQEAGDLAATEKSFHKLGIHYVELVLLFCSSLVGKQAKLDWIRNEVGAKYDEHL